jgi:hypothetical protein
VENKPLKQFVLKEQKKMQENNDVIQPRPKSGIDDLIDPHEKFDPYIPEDNFVEYSEEALLELMDFQKQMVDKLKDLGQPKQLADRVLAIIDDPIGANVFSYSKQNVYTQFSTRHRHLSISSIVVTQAYKEIPKTVRTNFTTMVLFEISNDSELAEIYKENTVGLKEKEWLEVYRHCTKEAFSFMFFNHKKLKEDGRIMKNFEKYILLTE